MIDYLKPLLKKLPDKIMPVIGANDIEHTSSQETLAKIKTLIDVIHGCLPDCHVVISKVLKCADEKNRNNKIDDVNKSLKSMSCDSLPQQNITFDLLDKTGLHLNFFSNKQLAKNIIEKLRSLSHGHNDTSAIEENVASTSLTSLPQRGVLISSVNVNGLIRNLEELKLLLAEKGIHILVINETKLDNIGNEIISVEGFTLRRNDRNKHGGRVAMYIKEGIKYIVRGDLPINNLEPICIEVQQLRSEPFNIVSWYRPPNVSIDSFLQLQRVLAYIDREGKETILLGDTNCDFIERPGPSSYVKNLKNLYQLYGYTQAIKVATRITPTNSALIDHVAVTNKHNILKSGVITTAFSDHYVVYCSRKFCGAFTKDHKLILCRKLKKF